MKVSKGITGYDGIKGSDGYIGSSGYLCGFPDGHIEQCLPDGQIKIWDSKSS